MKEELGTAASGTRTAPSLNIRSADPPPKSLPYASRLRDMPQLDFPGLTYGRGMSWPKGRAQRHPNNGFAQSGYRGNAASQSAELQARAILDNQPNTGPHGEDTETGIPSVPIRSEDDRNSAAACTINNSQQSEQATAQTKES
jgi:hypothetical protein